MNDETNEELESPGFMERIKESPRTVSALIIILIVAAAIYAFSGEPNKNESDLANNNEAAITEDAGVVDVVDDTEGEAAAEGESDATTPNPPAATPAQPTVMPGAVVSPEKLQEMNRALPAGERQDRAYVEAAEAGDGITHLARRATTRYLAENNAGYAITQEHRIYIEDYIQNSLGSDRLSVGETRTISFDLVAEAVMSAGELNQSQLQNLSHYTSALN